MTSVESVERSYDILVYGIDRKRLPLPSDPIKRTNFSLTFAGFDSHLKFNEFDGVILFQGIFENFSIGEGVMGSYVKHSCKWDDLDKRKKEARLLTNKGGFLCFLLNEPFMDRDRDASVDYKGSDLAKFHLNRERFSRGNFNSRVAHVTTVLDEFRLFLETYGAAYSQFSYPHKDSDVRVVARVGDSPVGLLIDQLEYFVPTLIPDARADAISDYFCILAEAITSVHNKRGREVPDWAKKYNFGLEDALHAQRKDLTDSISIIDSKLAELNLFKGALVHSGPQLVEDVKAMLTAALGVNVNSDEEFREDLKLLNDEAKVVAVCEVKGINRGIKREHINQTDSHRERSGYNDNFPAILIANIAIKESKSIADKDQEISLDQVRHAYRSNILVMRTYDLMGILRLVISGAMSQVDARSLVLSNAGWLRVSGDVAKVITGED